MTHEEPLKPAPSKRLIPLPTATRQEQLIHLHHLSLKESALKEQITILNQEQDDLTRSLCQNLPQEQWVWVSDEMIAYVNRFNYEKSDRSAITFKDLKRVDDKV